MEENKGSQSVRILSNLYFNFSFHSRLLITEAYASVDNTIRYYKDFDNTLGSHFPFNFGMIEYLNEHSNAHQFKNVIDEWIRKMPPGATANWVLGNHDKPRFGSRYGIERIDGMQMLLMILPGIAITYNVKQTFHTLNQIFN